VKILDFGIAKVMRGESSIGMSPNQPQLTATGQTLGTLEYMSPEQLMGRPLDGRSDVYALGVVAYELITGRLPFPDAKGPAALITAQLKQSPTPPSEVNPGSIPVGVDRIVLKCLEKDRNHRFGDMTQLASAVTECLSAGGMWGSAPAGQPSPPRVMTPQPMAPLPQPMAPPMQPMAAPMPMGLPAMGPPPAMQPHALGYGGVPRAPMAGDATGPATRDAIAAARGSTTWVWIVVGIVALGAVIGAVLAQTM